MGKKHETRGRGNDENDDENHCSSNVALSTVNLECEIGRFSPRILLNSRGGPVMELPRPTIKAQGDYMSKSEYFWITRERKECELTEGRKGEVWGEKGASKEGTKRENGRQKRKVKKKGGKLVLIWNVTREN